MTLYSGDDFYGDEVTSPLYRPLPAVVEALDDEPLYCESCGEPLDAAAAHLVGGEMWCEHCATDGDDPAPEGLTRIPGRAWVD